MGTKNNPGKFDCYESAEDDEPMFVLLARDPLAPVLVDLWAELREMRYPLTNKENVAKVDEATDCADAMREWKRALDRRVEAEATRQMAEDAFQGKTD